MIYMRAIDVISMIEIAIRIKRGRKKKSNKSKKKMMMTHKLDFSLINDCSLLILLQKVKNQKKTNLMKIILEFLFKRHV